MSMMDIDSQGPHGSTGDSQPVTGIIYPPPDIRSKTTKTTRAIHVLLTPTVT